MFQHSEFQFQKQFYVLLRATWPCKLVLSAYMLLCSKSNKLYRIPMRIRGKNKPGNENVRQNRVLH
uniref:Uncharacterized protein n=1 Tax=Arundo donax TaxID=35708 RepID=A0A0A9DUT0_ARUDO